MPFKKNIPLNKQKAYEKEKLKKGQLLIVKVPPLYDKEYLYEIISAGDKLIRVNLFHSPKVKKQWSLSDFDLLFDSGMIRFAPEQDTSTNNISNLESDE